MNERVPLHVLTGFLGSGKTAVLRSLLERTDEPIGVLVNEVGELGLDHHLLERVDEDVFLLPGGCVCCALRGELHGAVDRVLATGATHLVLETTGLADPAPLLHTVGADPRLAERVRLGGVTAVVDCLRAEELAAEHAEVRRQLELADRVILTKIDLAPQRADDVRAWLEREVPGREVRVAEHGAVDVAWLLETAGFGSADGARGWLRAGAGAWSAPVLDARPAESPHAPFTTHALRHPHPVDVAALELWLRLVTQVDGPRLLRIKALARCRATGAAFALQSAGRSVTPPRRMAVAPESLTGAEVVVIERGLDGRAVEQLLASLRGALRA